MIESTTLQSRRRWLAGCAAAVVSGGLAVSPVLAQEAYPAKPITLIVPFAPGGSTDIVARLVAERMQRDLGQPVVVENRAGAGGSIGANAVARAAADGYTIGMGTVSTLNVNPVLFKSNSPDPLTAFAPITALASVPSVFATHPDLGVTDYPGFLEVVRAKPGEYNYGSPGTGSIGQVIMEALNHELGVQVQHIAYRGMGPVINGALAGETQVFSDQYPSASVHIKAGKLVPFAVGANERLEGLPNIPTFTELGHPDLNDLAITWFGLVAPAGTPAPVVERLQKSAAQALEDPALRARLDDLGLQPIGNTPAEFTTLIADGLARVQAVVDARSIKLD